MPSPRPTLDFFTALREVFNGVEVTKLEWNNPDIYLCLRDSKLVIHQSDGFHPFIVRDADMVGTDWTIIHRSPLN